VAGEEVTRLAPVASRLTARADLVGVSRHDLAPGTRPATLLSLLRPGARLLVTDGLDGGRVFEGRGGRRIGTRRYGAVAADRDVDPTGAGDVFLAAVVTALARGRDDFGASRSMASALRFAATAASFVVEAPGLHGVPGLSAVLARLGRANDPVVPSS
jgi:sugar/nucleoside kinase (ribokinase family)